MTVLIQEIQLNSAFTPAAPIQSEELFSGRLSEIVRLVDSVLERGQHVVLYGERGVGKTSLANVIVKKFADTVKTSCDSADTFSAIWRRLLAKVEFESDAAKAGQQNLFTLAERAGDNASKVAELTEFLVRWRVEGLFIIDEYDEVVNMDTKRSMAELLKHLSDNAPLVTVMLVGVSKDVTTLVGHHPSVERCIRQIHLPRMTEAELRDIVERGERLANVRYDADVKNLIVVLAQGFPHFTHLLAKHSGLRAVRAGRAVVDASDLRSALDSALRDANASVVDAYERATYRAGTSLYKQVLLATALAKPVSVESAAVRPKDMELPLSRVCGKRYTVVTFNKHLKTLCSDEGGKTLERIGVARKFRYRFANPLLKPYVLLKAMAEGIDVTGILREIAATSTTAATSAPRA